MKVMFQAVSSNFCFDNTMSSGFVDLIHNLYFMSFAHGKVSHLVNKYPGILPRQGPHDRYGSPRKAIIVLPVLRVEDSYGFAMKARNESMYQASTCEALGYI